ncbi:hypothetical protein K402DRAFT_455264 [Aulographum hederae CBS 113979]|uniref:Uncharacterized protein n=1 Tax=Aulographum hederae CBS 113979 TaxID=1176131 RepID=A0A6G1GWG1_9PEZI|nr:hypothetical protein K402DRAFT_455264 [Aulographum hederae CBS 113979]
MVYIRSSSAFVCLQCRLRHTPFTHSPSFRRLKIASASYSASSSESPNSSRSASSEAGSREEEAELPNDTHTFSSETHRPSPGRTTDTSSFAGFNEAGRQRSERRETLGFEWSSSGHFDEEDQKPKRWGRYRYPLGKVRGKPGKQQLREGSAALNIKSLGKPSEVIILRDEPMDVPPTPPSSADEADRESLSDKELFEAIDQEKIIPGREDVKQYLDSLRPVTERALGSRSLSLPSEDFDALHKKIYSGFTSSQLSDYITAWQAASQGNETDKKKERRTATSKATPKVSSWRVGTSDIKTRHRPAVHTSFSAKKNTKTKLAGIVLRHVWGIEGEGDLEAEGEMEILVPAWELQLFASHGNPTALDQVGINRRVKLDVYWHDHVIRVTADKHRAHAAMGDITGLRRSICSERVDRHILGLTRDEGELSPRINQHLSPIAKATQTAITKKLGHILIHAFDQSRVDDAKRLLLATSRSPSVLDPKYKRWGPGGRLPKLHLQTIPTYRNLPLHMREFDFVRWIAPTVNVAVSPPTKAPAPVSGTVASNFARGITKDFEESTAPSTTSPYQSQVPADEEEVRGSTWSPPVANYSAYFGYALKRGDVALMSVQKSIEPKKAAILGTPAANEETRNLVQYNDSKQPDYAFLHTQPHRSRLLRYLQRTYIPQPGNHLNNSLTFRLIQSPWSSTKETSEDGQTMAYPEIRLRLQKSTADGVFCFHSMHAVLSTHVADLLLPNHAVDIRVTKEEIIHCSEPETVPSMSEYVGSIQSSIARGGQIRAPDTLRLRMPQWTRRSKENATIPDNVSDGSPYVEVDYAFVGVEHGQALHYEFEGLPLTFGDVEAGIIGGSRAELKIDLPWQDATGAFAGGDESKGKDFITKAIALVDLITEGSARGLPSSGYRKKRSFTVGTDEELDGAYADDDQQRMEGLKVKEEVKATFPSSHADSSLHPNEGDTVEQPVEGDSNADSGKASAAG